MAGQFMKKCSQCDRLGAPYQSTTEQGDTQQLCHDCFQEQSSSTDSDAESKQADD